LNEQDAQKQRHTESRKNELEKFRQAQTREKRRMAAAERLAGDELTRVPTDFLKFGGEDPNMKDRVRAQKLQQQDWLAQQIADLQQREQNEQDEQNSYDAMQQRITEIQGEQQARVAVERQRKRDEVLEFNKQLASQKRSMRTQELQLNQNLDDAELTQTLNSGLMNEAGNDGVTTNFKGFTTEERQRILDIQQMQMDDKNARRAQEEEEERVFAAQQEDIRRARLINDREQSAWRKQQRMQLQDDQRKQAEEKTIRYDYLDNVVYTNPTQSSYFEQFGRSCR
jgi:hypothetical protein